MKDEQNFKRLQVKRIGVRYTNKMYRRERTREPKHKVKYMTGERRPIISCG